MLSGICMHPVAIWHMPVVMIAAIRHTLVDASQHVCWQVALAVSNHMHILEQ